MKNQLLDYLVSMYTQRAINKIAKHIQEKPAQVAASLESFIPAITCAIAKRSTSSMPDAFYVTRKAVEANKNRLKYARRHIELQYQKMEDNEDFLIYLFGGNNEWKIVAEDIGKQYGLALYSSIVLMQILMPVCLSNIGKTITDYDMSLSQVISFLKAQGSALGHEGGKQEKDPFLFPENVSYRNAAYSYGHRNQKIMVACLAGALLVLFDVCGYYFHMV